MDVKCGNGTFAGQDIVVMIKFTDELDALVTTGMAEWLRPVCDMLDRELRDAIKLAMYGKGKQFKTLHNPREKQQ